MNNSKNYNSKDFSYISSITLQSAAIYGFKAIILLYLINSNIAANKQEAGLIFGLYASGILLFQIIGAIIGDLILGNRKSILLGGILLVLGFFSLCIPSMISIYISLALIVIGNGLFTSNLISNYGKGFLSRNNLIDSGYILFYVAMSVGSFLGTLLISYFVENYGWIIGFLIIGLFMLLSIATLFFINLEQESEIQEHTDNKNISYRNIIVAILLITFFWAIADLSDARITEIELVLGRIFSSNSLHSIMPASNAMFVIPLGIIFVICYTLFYTNQYFKILIGFIFGALSFGVLFSIPEVPTDQYFYVFLLHLLFFSISEIHIAPIVLSIITKYGNPKYLTILLSLLAYSSKLMSFVVTFFLISNNGNSSNGLVMSFLLMSVITLGLLVWGWRYKKINF